MLANVTAGADTVSSGNGNDLVIGGALADRLTSGDGSDVICGDHCKIVMDRTNDTSFQLGLVISLVTNTTAGVYRLPGAAPHRLLAGRRPAR
jgi:Ca2+-binding RTX toxin-like protein